MQWAGRPGLEQARSASSTAGQGGHRERIAAPWASWFSRERSGILRLGVRRSRVRTSHPSTVGPAHNSSSDSGRSGRRLRAASIRRRIASLRRFGRWHSVPGERRRRCSTFLPAKFVGGER